MGVRSRVWSVFDASLLTDVFPRNYEQVHVRRRVSIVERHQFSILTPPRKVQTEEKKGAQASGGG